MFIENTFSNLNNINKREYIHSITNKSNNYRKVLSNYYLKHRLALHCFHMALGII